VGPNLWLSSYVAAASGTFSAEPGPSVPEPSTLLLVAPLLGMGLLSWKRKARA